MKKLATANSQNVTLHLTATEKMLSGAVPRRRDFRRGVMFFANGADIGERRVTMTTCGSHRDAVAARTCWYCDRARSRLRRRRSVCTNQSTCRRCRSATGLTTGVLTFFFASRDGLHGVPLVVMMWASVALTVSGLIARCFFRAHAPVKTLRCTAAAVLAVAPFVGVLALLSLQHACPLSVTRGSDYCFYDQDHLGGWSAAVGRITSLDLIVIAFLIWLSADQSERDGREKGADDHASISA